MADTTYDLLVEALTDLGVLADGEIPSASQAQGGLSKLNSMLDAWNLDSLMVYGSTGFVFPPVPGQATYTIGAGGNFTIPRSAKLSAIYLRTTDMPASNQLDTPVWYSTNAQWQSVPLKGMTGSIPVMAWVNETYPLASVTLTPVPDSTQYKIVIWADGVLGPLGLYDLVALPPGYREAIVANLAIRMAPGYQAEVSPITAQIASNGKDMIRANNLQVNVLQIDPRLTGAPLTRSQLIGGQW